MADEKTNEIPPLISLLWFSIDVFAAHWSRKSVGRHLVWKFNQVVEKNSRFLTISLRRSTKFVAILKFVSTNTRLRLTGICNSRNSIVTWVRSHNRKAVETGSIERLEISRTQVSRTTCYILALDACYWNVRTDHHLARQIWNESAHNPPWPYSQM